MNKTSFLVISILLMACSDQESVKQTLNRSIDDVILENLRTLNGMETNVRDMGMRKDDVTLLETSKNLYKAKDYFNLPNSSENFDTDFEVIKALSYLDSLKSTYSTYDVKIDQNLLSLIEELSTNIRISKSTKDRLIYINILKLESEFLFNRGRRIGVNCGFFGCFTFGLNTDNDTIYVGDFFESILTINERGLENEDLTFDSISISLNGLPIDFKGRQIGNAHHLQFIAEQIGTYKYSGILVAKNNELDYEVTCDFEYEIVCKAK